MGISQSNKFIISYVLFSFIVLSAVLCTKIGQENFASLAYGLSIFSFSVILLVLLSSEILGRDSMGFSGVSPKFMRTVVFVLTGLKFFLVGGLIYLGFRILNLNGFAIVFGAFIGLASATATSSLTWNASMVRQKQSDLY